MCVSLSPLPPHLSLQLKRALGRKNGGLGWCRVAVGEEEAEERVAAELYYVAVVFVDGGYGDAEEVVERLQGGWVGELTYKCVNRKGVRRGVPLTAAPSQRRRRNRASATGPCTPKCPRREASN